MGLDMYLSAKKYVSGYEFQSAEKRAEYQAVVSQFGVKGSSEAPSAEVSITIGYWRKANAIHGWFVRECGGGVDECQAIYVPREKLLELKNLCLAALANKPKVLERPIEQAVSITADEVAVQAGVMKGEEMPGDIMTKILDAMKLEAHSAEFNDEDDTDPLRPVAGFFFGGTAKDEWYYQDLSETVSIINEALALPEEGWSFEYRASW